jgi:phosphinothricin acetyltransferase
MMIREVIPEKDAAAIAGIYNYYIEETPITFEETPLSAPLMEARIRSLSAKYPYFVWEEGGEVTGYAYLDEYHERSAYRFTVSDSIYLKKGSEGKGHGSALLSRLVEEGRARGFHVIMALITEPNDRSTGLHKKLGFTRAGLLHEVGFKLEHWLDVGYWERKI